MPDQPWEPYPNFLDPPTRYREPLAPHRVVGPLHAVGTRDLGVFLIVGDEGHILVNTGLHDSAGPIRRNVEALGFHLEDVSILLTQQSHWDHTAALAEIKDLTGASVLATEGDTRVLEDGGFSDPHFGGGEMFAPVAVDERISHGDVLALGNIRLVVHEHPGHTEGSSSYTMEVVEGDRTLSVAIVNMATVNQGKRLVVDPTYPGVADDFSLTFARQRALRPDVWVAAHGTHYGLEDKWDGAAGWEAFADPDGYAVAIDRLEGRVADLVAAERNARD